MANAPNNDQAFWAVIKVEGPLNQQDYNDLKQKLQQLLGSRGQMVFKTVVSKKTKAGISLVPE